MNDLTIVTGTYYCFPIEQMMTANLLKSSWYTFQFIYSNYGGAIKSKWKGSGVRKFTIQAWLHQH